MVKVGGDDAKVVGRLRLSGHCAHRKGRGCGKSGGCDQAAKRGLGGMKTHVILYC